MITPIRRNMPSGRRQYHKGKVKAMSESKNILVIDDEIKIREVLFSYLTAKGFHIYLADSGTEALALFQKFSIDLIILDLMLPDLSGEEICTRIRRKSSVPIIMLTAKTMETDMINGLKIGADDYIVKPFSLKELYARMEALLRRCGGNLNLQPSPFAWQDDKLSVDTKNKKVTKNGRPVNLTKSEWNLLTTLVNSPQRVFSRTELLDIALDPSFCGYDRIIDTHIKNLRKKIEDDPRSPVYIETVHGLGYRFGGKML